MGQGPRFRPAFRRRREGRTDYRRRLHILQGRTTRLVVRRSNRFVTVQFVDFDARGDVVRAGATSKDLSTLGWDRSSAATPAAYLTGFLAAQRAKKMGIARAVVDLGHFTPVPGGRLFAAVKGVLDAGIEVPHDPEVLPDEKRIQGEHLPDAPLAKFQNALAKIKETA